MVGMKEFCALLLAGGMGATSVVAVQKARPAVSKARAVPLKPKVQKAVQQSAQMNQTQECQTIAPIGPAIDSLVPLQTAESLFGLQPVSGFGSGGGSGGGGGGFGPGINPGPIPVAPGIPQPDTWVMLVAGFGFLGLALRRRPGLPDSERGTLPNAGPAGHMT